MQIRPEVVDQVGEQIRAFLADCATQETFATAAVVAIGWAEAQTAERGLPAVLVTDDKRGYDNNPLFRPTVRVDTPRGALHASTCVRAR